MKKVSYLFYRFLLDQYMQTIPTLGLIDKMLSRTHRCEMCDIYNSEQKSWSSFMIL